MLLSKRTDASLVGYDLSSEMIEVANIKAIDCPKCSFTDNKSNISGRFDLFMSMFYVVNHLINLSDLRDLFSSASEKINEGGLFVFDCWNGIAAIKDPPYSAERERYSDDDNSIVTACMSSSDLLNSSVLMDNVVNIVKDGKTIRTFSYKLRHTIWTPYLLKQLLTEYNFEIMAINKTYDIDKEIHEKDYKMVFVCRRGKDS